MTTLKIQKNTDGTFNVTFNDTELFTRWELIEGELHEGRSGLSDEHVFSVAEEDWGSITPQAQAVLKAAEALIAVEYQFSVPSIIGDGTSTPDTLGQTVDRAVTRARHQSGHNFGEMVRGIMEEQGANVPSDINDDEWQDLIEEWEG